MDFSKLTAAIAALAAAVAGLNANGQAKIDKATADVEAITNSITPAPPTP